MNNPLFFVFLVPLIMDVLGTVAGQRREYWVSKYKKYDEAMPIAHWLLQLHPVVFIIACLGFWIPVTYILVLYLPEPYNLWVSMILFSGHSYNSVAWLRKTQANLGIFQGKGRVSIALSLIPMALYVIFIGFIATWGLLQYVS